MSLRSTPISSDQLPRQPLPESGADLPQQLTEASRRVAGTRVSEEGEVTFRGHERVDYRYLITSKKVGDSVRLSVLRGSHSSDPGTPFDLSALAAAPEAPKPLEFQVTLTPTVELV